MATYLTSEVIGAYRPIEQIGATCLATVYRAEHVSDGHTVALKVLRPFFASEEAAVQQFLDEIVRVRQLRHPNILPVVDIGGAASESWIALQYVPWPTLRQRLRQPVSLDGAVAILRQVAAALDYAHRNQVFHGNLKPNNVFVNPQDGHVQVADFGTAFLVKGIHPLLRSNLNTPLAPYTAPEQGQGVEVTARSDVYSLGALAYHMMTGVMPFLSLDHTTVLVRQLRTTPPLPSDLNPQLPLEVDSVLLRALGRYPEQRYASASELIEALSQALSGTDLQLVMTQPLNEDDETPDRLFVSPRELGVASSSLETVVCPLCAHVNLPVASRCASCWANLIDEEGVDKSEERRLVRRFYNRRLRWQLVRWAVAVAVLVPLGVWSFLQVVDVGTPPPATAPEVSAPVATNLWALPRGDFQNTGFAGSAAAVGAGQTKWTFETDAPLLASPVIVGDRVYLGSGDFRVVALDRGSGDLIWEFPTTGPIPSSPTVAGDYLYFGLLDGRVLALERNTGKLAWEYETANPVMGSVLVKSGTVYVGSGDKKLYALDAVSGALLWSWQTDGWIISTPVLIDETTLVVTSMDGIAYFLDTTTGRKRLTYDAAIAIHGSPAAVGDQVVFTNQRGIVFAVDGTKVEYPGERGWRTVRINFWVWQILPSVEPQKGTLWAIGTGGRVYTDPAIAYDTVYITTATGELIARDASNGSPQWRASLDSDAPTSPTVAGEYVLVGNGSGTLQAFDVSSGELQWEFATGGPITAPVSVAGGDVYLSSRDGTLYVLQP